jgi:hypothetical protein
LPDLEIKKRQINYLLIFLCLIAGLRVWLYAAAFPFFGNVDEVAHVDLVIKYSHGEIPRSITPYSQESAVLIYALMSPEYVTPVEKVDGKFPLPWWKKNGWGTTTDYDPKYVAITTSHLNYESLQPPLYYFLAGTWLNVLSFFSPGKEDTHEPGFYKLYWLRFFNVILIILLIWLVYKSATTLFPEKPMTVYAIAGLVALMPQDTFYSVQSDVLSPVCFGFVFLYCLRFMSADHPSSKLGFALGLSTAATVLVKQSNLPSIILVSFVVAVKAFHLYKAKNLRTSTRTIMYFFLCSWIPLLLWFCWNLVNVGTLTASEGKMQELTWTYKPFSEWFNNSLFTFSGIKNFWTELMVTFWRGELIFNSKRLALPAADTFFWSSSLLFLVLAFTKYVRIKNSFMKLFTSWSFLTLIIFLIILSMMFDYGQCGYPSKEQPYFRSGRLISAGLIPFCILYVCGFEFGFSWIRNKQVIYVLFWIILCLITISEAIISVPVFKSQYNFINL